MLTLSVYKRIVRSTELANSNNKIQGVSFDLTS